MSKEDEVLMWHVSVKPDGSFNEVAAVTVPFGDVDILRFLLQTDNPGGKTVNYDTHTGYMFAYDNNLTRPYPSVIIFRYDRSEKGNIAVDMEKEDMRAYKYACEHFFK